MKKMMRMYQLDVDVNENDEVILSQARRDDGPASGVVIPYDQIEAVCAVLTKAGEQIESRREASDADGEQAEEDHRRTASVRDRR
jgi:hypothetical protein